jgi:poly(A) polymerase
MKSEMVGDIFRVPHDEGFVLELSRAFQARGEELYLVGGTVRDRLLGRSSPDIDLTTSARPPQVVDILEKLNLGKIYRLGEKFGTIGLLLARGNIEITTYRSAERYLPGSRKPEVRFGRSLLEDLKRRDFTANAIALDPVSGDIVDPLGGRADLDSRIIRAVGRPLDRFAEDPLRLLRAVRFAAELGFQIEPETWHAICEAGARLGLISRERIRDELTRIITGPRAVVGLTLLRDSGLLGYSVPELLELTRMADHGPRHPLSLWDHTMAVVVAAPDDVVSRWAALLHDIAKPRTRTHDLKGRPRFFHHEEKGAEIARTVLSGLRYPNQLISDVSLLIETHMQVHSYAPEWSDGAVRRLALRLGPLLPRALALARADAAGHALTGTSRNSARLDALEERVRRVGEAGAQRPESPLNGHDLMARYGRPPGPWIRKIKDHLEDDVIEGTLDPDDRDRAWEIADALVARLDEDLI